MNKLNKDKPSHSTDDLIKEVHRVTEADIRATGIRQCQTHSWRKLSDNELECTKCPTAIIVSNINDYI